MKGKLLLALSSVAVALAIAIGLTRAEGFASQTSVRSTMLVGSAFTYQGQLKTNGTPVNSVCDLRFSLWDSPGDVTGQIGITQTRTGLAVTNGLFTINDLDFGGSAFNGDARWLQIDVRCPTGSGSYTTLTPRQSITAVPYAQYSRVADLLDGQHASAFAAATHAHSGDQITSTVATATLALSSTQAPWSGLTGIPAGFADNVDNDTTYMSGAGLVLSGTQFSVNFAGTGSAATAAHSDHHHYLHTIVVSPIGTATENGPALLSALTAIIDASATNPYLLKIEPGVYDLVTATLHMKPYVDIEGSGELVTTITGGGWLNPAGTITGTIAGADNAELRFLTVKNSGDRLNTIAVYNDSASPRLTHVTISAFTADFSSHVYGVYNRLSSPQMTDVDISAAAGVESYGVYNDQSSPTMTDLTVRASGGGVSNYGVYNNSSSPQMTRVTANASGGSTEVGVNSGVYNASASSPEMTDVVATAEGAHGSYGVYNSDSTPTMLNVRASCTGAHAVCTGVRNNSSSPTMNNVIALAIGGKEHTGVDNSGSSPSMINVTAIGSGFASWISCGVRNSTSSPTMSNVTAVSTGSASSNYGVCNLSSAGVYTVTIDNSRISGNSATIQNSAGFTTLVGASRLEGGSVITGTGTVICAGVYDENYSFYASTCP